MHKLTSCRDEPEKYGNKAAMKTQEGYPTMERWHRIKTRSLTTFDALHTSVNELYLLYMQQMKGNFVFLFHFLSLVN